MLITETGQARMKHSSLKIHSLWNIALNPQIGLKEADIYMI